MEILRCEICGNKYRTDDEEAVKQHEVCKRQAEIKSVPKKKAKSK